MSVDLDDRDPNDINGHVKVQFTLCAAKRELLSLKLVKVIKVNQIKCIR